MVKPRESLTAEGRQSAFAILCVTAKKTTLDTLAALLVLGSFSVEGLAHSSSFVALA
tara:strand:- start:644 stop:814 length:171 start_codon:yes stop_codon:yes gene_type:complete